jgi:hypothetical protein
MTNADDEPPASNAEVGEDVGVPSGAGKESGSAGPTPVLKSYALESLASRYVTEQHETYLRHLQESTKEPRNLNIALTGRYGTGKSSVLDQFESEGKKRTLRTAFKKKSKTLRITISTLGSNSQRASSEETGSEETALTNRIQKELVKQLIYRMSPRDFRFSRFNRIVPLSRKRAVGEASISVIVVGGILWFFKLLPDIKLLPGIAGIGPGHQWLVHMVSWLALAALVVIVLATVRLVIYGRFVVSDVSAAGATVKLSPRSSTYFDEYLEEIVYFFDKVFPDVVIFEDLDRFDDPHIFEALRELNTLLNETPKRLKKRKPLRFVYAIKDSLFERLGSDAEKSKGDAAAAETVRANRTKFFDVVIPVVPFISHRNARELLDELLKVRSVTDIDRPLVALVAQHATDMRLLRNICNEYVVFAERLLKSDKTAPGLTATNLFALVAYKNFHLEDFEHISRRDSDLDVLYARRRELVRSAIDDCEKHKRDLLNEPARHKSRVPLAAQLGGRLVTIGTVTKDACGLQAWQHLRFTVDGVQHLGDRVNSYQFWAAVAKASVVLIYASPDPNSGNLRDAGKLDRGQIQKLFPEAMDVDRWAEIDERTNQETLKRLDADIAFLRGADFKDLVRESRFTLPVEGNDKTFADLVDTTMKSQLARQLVQTGYLDRNFTLYAAQFYGDFTGIDVANFIVHTVETNTMDIDYAFSGPEAVANLLLETPEYFSRTISAYNTEVLDHLLKQNDALAADIADTVAADFGDEARKFLSSYLNSGSERASFAALLSERPWLGVFTYLTKDADIPADVRPALIDAALRGSKDAREYELNSDVRDFIVENYSKMEIFTSQQDDKIAAKVVAFIKEMNVVLPELAGLDETIRDRVVHHNLYRLTADNLRVALNTTSDVSFDHVRKHLDVYDRCRMNPDEYLAVMQNDSRTPHSFLTEPTLIGVLAELPEAWSADHVRGFIAMAAPGSRLERLDSVPERCWSDLAAHHLFRATVRNIQAYRDTIGSIDQSLADLLVQAERIDGAGEDETAEMNVAVSVLNATDTIPQARKRVDLVVGLQLEHYVTPADIEPEGGGYLALLLANRVVDDSIEAFARFQGAGWAAIESAIEKSKNFAEFMTPELVSSFIPDLLRSRVVPPPAKEKVIDDLDRYVPHDDDIAFSAAGDYVLDQKRFLPLEQVGRIAAVTRDENLTLRLLISLSPPVTELVPVLTQLGEPYSYLTSRTKNEFDLPADALHRTILNRLKRAGAISGIKKRPIANSYIVKLA